MSKASWKFQLAVEMQTIAVCVCVSDTMHSVRIVRTNRVIEWILFSTNAFLLLKTYDAHENNSDGSISLRPIEIKKRSYVLVK